MKIKGNEAYTLSPDGFLAIEYSQFDIGMKWKLYRKVKYDGGSYWSYVESFERIFDAQRYMKMSYDGETKR